MATDAAIKDLISQANATENATKDAHKQSGSKKNTKATKKQTSFLSEPQVIIFRTCVWEIDIVCRVCVCVCVCVDTDSTFYIIYIDRFLLIGWVIECARVSASECAELCGYLGACVREFWVCKKVCCERGWVNVIAVWVCCVALQEAADGSGGVGGFAKPPAIGAKPAAAEAQVTPSAEAQVTPSAEAQVTPSGAASSQKRKSAQVAGAGHGQSDTDIPARKKAKKLKKKKKKRVSMLSFM